jgi:hypothetical protein
MLNESERYRVTTHGLKRQFCYFSLVWGVRLKCGCGMDMGLKCGKNEVLKYAKFGC